MDHITAGVKGIIRYCEVHGEYASPSHPLPPSHFTETYSIVIQGMSKIQFWVVSHLKSVQEYFSQFRERQIELLQSTFTAVFPVPN